MFTSRRFITAFLILVLLAGCGGYPALRQSNRANLAKLDIGMTKQQVMTVMGQEGFGSITNPYRVETFALGNDIYEALFYYTDQIGEIRAADTGMTPIILKNGKFIGAGKEFLFKLR